LKKVLAIILLSAFVAMAQVEDVSVNHKVYNFLEKLSVLNVINNYNPFEIPISRKQVAQYLSEASVNASQLNQTDKEILQDLMKEFEFDMTGSLASSDVMIGEKNYDIFSQDPKYFYSYNKPGSGNVFINVLAEGSLVGLNTLQEKSHSVLGIYGGEIRGTLLNKVGFFIKATDGSIFGDRKAALRLSDLKYNWNLVADQNSFFDETEGYATVDFDFLHIKFGRDRELIGRGVNKLIMGDYAPESDFISLNFNLGIFEFSSFHGKIIGNKSGIADTVTGGIATVEDKYFGYHRLGVNISKDISFGAGEIILYANRPLDISYLNPFAFYKTVEHSNQDRDNSMLFFDLSSNPLKGLKLYSLVLIDDIDFSKMGTGWFGNQTAFNLGVAGYNPYKGLPIDFCFEYFRIEPYVFSHRIKSNNYTNDDYNIGMDTDPNSKIFFWKLNYQLTSRINLSAQYTYRVHGANPVNLETGEVTNVGGDIQLGHRESDATHLHFLDGTIEYFRKLSLAANYEPFPGYIIKLILNNETNSLQNNVKVKDWFFQSDISLRL